MTGGFQAPLQWGGVVVVEEVSMEEDIIRTDSKMSYLLIEPSAWKGDEIGQVSPIFR
jgi:hypothetical protein